MLINTLCIFGTSSEALEAGTMQLVGVDVEKILSYVKELFTVKQLYQRTSYAPNPYRDGEATKAQMDFI